MEGWVGDLKIGVGRMPQPLCASVRPFKAVIRAILFALYHVHPFRLARLMKGRTLAHVDAFGLLRILGRPESHHLFQATFETLFAAFAFRIR